MAHIDLSRTYSTVEYDGFEGIDAAKAFNGKGGTKDLCDFRLRFDGALEKRGGFKLFAEFPKHIRAVHQLSDQALLILSGNILYSLHLPSGALTKLYLLESESIGRASFFSFNGCVYLIDGIELYRYSDGAFYVVHGYVPLYGKNWDPLNGGEVNEPLNTLSRRARFSFNADSETYQFNIPFLVISIDAVLINGEEADKSKFWLSDDNKTIHTEEYYDDGTHIEFFLTLSTIYTNRELITACRNAATFGDGSMGTNKVQVAFHNGTNKNAIYPSTNVPDDQLALCNKIYSGVTSDLYVAAENVLYANDKQGAITAVCQKDDGLMVFTVDRAFMLTTDANKKSHLVRVSSSNGCSSSRGAIIFDDTPITVSHYGIFKWNPSSYEEGEYRASCISKPLHGLLPDSFFTWAIAYHYRKKGELWFSDHTDPAGTVFIYSIDSQAFYTFSGIGAEFFFECGGELGFFKGKNAYIFDSQKLTDTSDNEEKIINARIESGLISFGPFNRKKRLARCMIRTSPSASVLLSVTDAEGRKVSYRLHDGSGERTGYIEKRLSLHRSRHYSFTVETEGNAVIYGIILAAVS